MPRPRLQRAATARREKVQLRIREQSFTHFSGKLHEGVILPQVTRDTSGEGKHYEGDRDRWGGSRPPPPRRGRTPYPREIVPTGIPGVKTGSPSESQVQGMSCLTPRVTRAIKLQRDDPREIVPTGHHNVAGRVHSHASREVEVLFGALAVLKDLVLVLVPHDESELTRRRQQLQRVLQRADQAVPVGQHKQAAGHTQLWTLDPAQR